MEAAAEGAPLAETLHYWREGAHCISAWYSIIAPEKAGGNEAAANPRSSQRRGAANRPNGAWVASTPAGWRYPSAMPRELSPPKRFARCDTAVSFHHDLSGHYNFADVGPEGAPRLVHQSNR